MAKPSSMAPAGIFFGGIAGNLWELPSNFAPYAVRPTFSKVTSITHPYANDPTEFPGGTNPFPTLTFTPGTGTASFLALNQISSMDAHFKWPFTYQINFGIQQQINSGLAIGVNYVGSLNRRQPHLRGPEPGAVQHHCHRHLGRKLHRPDPGLRLCQ